LTGLSGSEYTSSDPELRGHWFDETVNAGAGIVRINVLWRTMVSSPPGNPSDPADPAYRFASLDAAVVDAAARGLQVMLTVYDAPAFAEGPNRQTSAPRGTWKPDPAQFGAFAGALATRYSGSYQGLPRVKYFEAWNEPNLSVFLSPQWNGKQPAAALHYRLMLNAFDTAVHDAVADAVVVTAGTAPYGVKTGGLRMHPLRFWRAVLCLKRDGRKLVGARCAQKPRFDILAHHPINTSGGPRHRAVHPDDASTPDLGKVRRTLRAAEKHGKVSGRHPLWATEIWWESDPPDTGRGVGLKKHARWSEEALYLLWKAGADAVINLVIRDPAYNPQAPNRTVEAGLFFRDGSPKPAFTAWRFPLVVDRRSSDRGVVWGRAPVGGQLRILKRLGAGWRVVERRNIRARKVFTEKVGLLGTPQFRATVGGESSLVWHVER
jgi:hypothetical protein